MWLLGPGHRVGRPVALRQTVREQERVRESALRGRLILTPTPHRPPGGSGRQGGRGCQQFREQLYNPTSVGDVISSKPVGCLRLPASHAHSVQSRRLGALRAEGNNSWCRQMMSSLNGFLPAMLDTSVFETGLIYTPARLHPDQQSTYTQKYKESVAPAAWSACGWPLKTCS